MTIVNFVGPWNSEHDGVARCRRLRIETDIDGSAVLMVHHHENGTDANPDSPFSGNSVLLIGSNSKPI